MTKNREAQENYLATFSLPAATSNLIAPDDRKLSRYLIHDQTKNISYQQHIDIVFTELASLLIASFEHCGSVMTQETSHKEMNVRSIEYIGKISNLSNSTVRRREEYLRKDSNEVDSASYVLIYTFASPQPTSTPYDYHQLSAYGYRTPAQGEITAESPCNITKDNKTPGIYRDYSYTSNNHHDALIQRNFLLLHFYKTKGVSDET